MKKAIVAGSTGFIGSAIVRALLRENIDVLALGRRPWKDINPERMTKAEILTYLQIDTSKIRSLPNQVKKIGWKPGSSCVFYYFSWSGVNRLTDGTISDQLKNVTYSTNAVLAANELGCTKFVNVGSQEETFTQKYLKLDWGKKDYHSEQGIYAVSKLTARDMCKIIAYLHKINFVHTRISVFVDENLSAVGYVPSVLKNILNGKSYDSPQNTQLFDLFPLEDAAKAYVLIGKYGKNKADYFIGSGEPRPLDHYFTQFKSIVNDESYLDVNNRLLTQQSFDADSFSINDLVNDTGMIINGTFDDFAKKVVNKWKKQ